MGPPDPSLALGATAPHPIRPAELVGCRGHEAGWVAQLEDHAFVAAGDGRALFRTEPTPQRLEPPQRGEAGIDRDLNPQDSQWVSRRTCSRAIACDLDHDNPEGWEPIDDREEHECAGASGSVHWRSCSLGLRDNNAGGKISPPRSMLRRPDASRTSRGRSRWRAILDPPGRRRLWAAVDLRPGARRGRGARWLHLPRAAAGGGPLAERSEEQGLRGRASGAELGRPINLLGLGLAPSTIGSSADGPPPAASRGR